MKKTLVARVNPEKVVKKFDEISSDKHMTESENLNVEPDRITYHLGRKISDGQFGNISVGMTLVSSVRKNETLEKATERVVNFVEDQVTIKTKELVES